MNKAREAFEKLYREISISKDKGGDLTPSLKASNGRTFFYSKTESAFRIFEHQQKIIDELKEKYECQAAERRIKVMEGLIAERDKTIERLECSCTAYRKTLQIIYKSGELSPMVLSAVNTLLDAEQALAKQGERE